MAGSTVQYTPLLQSPSSDDDDHDVVQYNRADMTGGGGGGGRGGGGGGGNSSSVRLAPIHFTDSTHSSKQNASSGAPVRGRKRRTVILAVLGVSLLVIGVVASAAFALLSHKFNAGVVHDVNFSRHGDWSIFFNKSLSDTGVTVVDVDGDGKDDVLMGITALQWTATGPSPSGMTARQHCLQKGLQYPCISQVVAVRGYDGRQLWRTWLRYDLLFVNCHQVDVNEDGQADCILSGRYSTLQAVDLASGKIHWVADADEDVWSTHLIPSWNVYRALTLPDVDGDGTQDFLVTHGGDPVKDPQDHDRASGRVILLSGRSGKPLGRYVEMPNSRETYMSPVTYQTANGSTFILLGSGGETVSGDLTIISYTDLYGYIMENKPLQLRTIFRGREKGVMMSPVLVDITGDGTLDILMSAFEGVLALYDGETLTEVWRRQLTSPDVPNLESYSVPALGRFDDDDVPDFMTIWGSGKYPEYDYAITTIQSGSDGSTLWERRSREMVSMYSPLSLSTQGHHDLFLTRTIGLDPLPRSAASSLSSSLHSDHSARGGRKHKRHIGAHGHSEEEPRHRNGSLENFQQMCETYREEYLQDSKACSWDLSAWRADVFLMGADHTHPVLHVTSTLPQPHHYTTAVTGGMGHCHPLSPNDDRLVDICIVVETSALQGGLGDVDGDGQPDFIQAEDVNWAFIADDYSVTERVTDVVLSRISLASTLKGVGPELLPMDRQPWRQFMGSSRDSVYRPPPPH